MCYITNQPQAGDGHLLFCGFVGGVSCGFRSVWYLASSHSTLRCHIPPYEAANHGHEVSHGDDVDHVKMIQRCKRGGMTPMMPSVGEFEGKLLCRLGDQGTKEGSQ